MLSRKIVAIIAAILLSVAVGEKEHLEETGRERRDSYLDAYAASHGANGNGNGNGGEYKAPVAPAPAPAPAPVYPPPAPAPQPPSIFGLDLQTILKVVGKILLFKLIIKVIAVLCVLLFIPKVELSMDKRDSLRGKTRN